MRWRDPSIATIAGGVALIGSSAFAADAKCGAATGKPATGEPIVIGGIVSVTGPDNFSSSGLAAQAYFKCLNANGGINGRPIKYLLEDDAWNPEQSSQVAAKLIRDEHAVALVGNMSFVDCGANQGIYEKEDIMVVAGVGVPRTHADRSRTAATRKRYADAAYRRRLYQDRQACRRGRRRGSAAAPDRRAPPESMLTRSARGNYAARPRRASRCRTLISSIS
jgi:Periplasmic binding protein